MTVLETVPLTGRVLLAITRVLQAVESCRLEACRLKVEGWGLGVGRQWLMPIQAMCARRCSSCGSREKRDTRDTRELVLLVGLCYVLTKMLQAQGEQGYETRGILCFGIP